MTLPVAVPETIRVQQHVEFRVDNAIAALRILASHRIHTAALAAQRLLAREVQITGRLVSEALARQHRDAARIGGSSVVGRQISDTPVLEASRLYAVNMAASVVPGSLPWTECDSQTTAGIDWVIEEFFPGRRRRGSASRVIALLISLESGDVFRVANFAIDELAALPAFAVFENPHALRRLRGPVVLQPLSDFGLFEMSPDSR